MMSMASSSTSRTLETMSTPVFPKAEVVLLMNYSTELEEEGQNDAPNMPKLKSAIESIEGILRIWRQRLGLLPPSLETRISTTRSVSPSTSRVETDLAENPVTELATHLKKRASSPDPSHSSSSAKRSRGSSSNGVVPINAFHKTHTSPVSSVPRKLPSSHDLVAPASLAERLDSVDLAIEYPTVSRTVLEEIESAVQKIFRDQTPPKQASPHLADSIIYFAKIFGREGATRLSKLCRYLIDKAPSAVTVMPSTSQHGKVGNNPLVEQLVQGWQQGRPLHLNRHMKFGKKINSFEELTLRAHTYHLAAQWHKHYEALHNEVKNPESSIFADFSPERGRGRKTSAFAIDILVKNMMERLRDEPGRESMSSDEDVEISKHLRGQLQKEARAVKYYHWMEEEFGPGIWPLFDLWQGWRTFDNWPDQEFRAIIHAFATVAPTTVKICHHVAELMGTPLLQGTPPVLNLRLTEPFQAMHSNLNQSKSLTKILDLPLPSTAKFSTSDFDTRKPSPGEQEKKKETSSGKRKSKRKPLSTMAANR